MSSVYRIAKWDSTFVKADGRKSKELHWVSVPLEFDSNGFLSMVEEFGDECEAMYGTWIALVAIAAKCSVPGTLATSKGVALSIERLSQLSRFKAESFEKLIKWASRSDIQWLELTDSSEDSQKTSESLPKTDEIPQLESATEVIPISSGPPPADIPTTRQDITIQNNTLSSPKAAAIAAGVSKAECLVVLELWNLTMGEKCTMTEDRLKQCKTRLKDPFFAQHWRESIGKVAQSDFCRGGGDQGWQFSFDDLLNSKKFVKVVEGRYDNRRADSKSGSRALNKSTVEERVELRKSARPRSRYEGAGT